MRVPYKEIAFYALVKWNGKSEEEAGEMINTLSVEELEKSVYAKSSVNHAIFSIASRLNLGKEETEEFYHAVYYGPEDAPIFNKVGKLINNNPCKELFVLEILSAPYSVGVLSSLLLISFVFSFTSTRLLFNFCV